jgi:hypothetical protein
VIINLRRTTLDFWPPLRRKPKRRFILAEILT